MVEQLPPQKIKRKSNKFPLLNQNPTLALFVRQTMREIENMQNDNVTKNLNPEQNLSLKSLKKMDNEMYKNMCSKILKDKKCYRKISSSIVDRYNQDFYRLVDEAHSEAIISRDLWDFVRTKYPRIPTMYALPKVYKIYTTHLGDQSSQVMVLFLKP